MFQFKDVVGQEAAKQRLRLEVQEGRIAHAMLFCGPAGSGKLALALAYAHYVCCPHRSAEDACGECPTCAKWNKLAHPDLHFLFPIVKNSKKKKELCDDLLPEWRNLLLETPYFGLNRWQKELGAENGQPIIYARESDELLRKLSLKSMEGGYKVVIIWLPEKLHEVCANKLLKLLEEPPSQTLFLLVSEAPERILPTILSRTQRFDVPRIEERDMALFLRQQCGLTEVDSANIAHLANGSLINALEAMKPDADTALFFELFVSLMRLAWQRKIREMKLWSEQVAALGRERQKYFLEYCQRMVRENFIYNFHCADMNYMTVGEENFSTRFAPYINERNVMGMMDELAQAQVHVEQNVNPRMIFFDFALKMIVLLKQ